MLGAEDGRSHAFDEPRIGNKIAFAGFVLGHERTEVRLFVRHALLHALFRLAAEQIVHRVEVIADRARMRHRIDEREMVGQLGQARVHLIDEHARHFGGDGFVRAAIIERSLRLHIPGVNVTRTTTEQDEDARLVRGDGLARGIHLVGAHHHSRQAKTQSA